MNIKIGKAKTVLLLHMNGTNGSQSFVDSSKNNCSVSAFDDAQISTAQSKYGGSAGYFTAGAGSTPAGTKSWLTTSSPLLDGVEAYTVEAWVYLSAPDYYRTVYSTRVVNTGSSFGFTDTNEMFAYSDATGGLFSGAVVPHSQWVHVAWSYDGTNLRMFIDGVKVYDQVKQLSHGVSSYIGRASIFPDANYGEFFIGYMDDFRITKGIARYTSNFTPPTSEFLSDSSLSITKGGSGKLNEKKYIDLLPLAKSENISKITLSGGTYGNGVYIKSGILRIDFSGLDDASGVNGIYTRSSTGYTKFVHNNSPSNPAEIWWYSSGGYWILSMLGEMDGEATFISYDLINWIDAANFFDGTAQIINILFQGPNNQKIVQNIFYNAFSSYDPNNWGHLTVYYSTDGITWEPEGSIEDDLGTPPTGVLQKEGLTFLFDPIFYKSEIQNERYKISVQGCSLSYVNGIYSLSLAVGLVNGRGYYIKDDDSSMVVNYEGENWYIRDLAERDYSADLFYKIEVGGNSRRKPFHELDWSTPDGGTAYDDNQTPPTMSEYLDLQYKDGGRLDPAFLEQIRNYQIDNTVPNEGAAYNLNPSSPQHIVGADFNTKKAEIKNNTFSYIKYSDNTDVEQKKLNKWYPSISIAQSDYGISPPIDSKHPLLRVRRNDSQPIFEIGPDKYSTLNMFIRLQRPVSHKNPNTGYIVREKRGIFCTSFDTTNESPFSIGYKSPYYNITGRPSYKSVFNNFSFVFSFGHVIYDAEFERPISRNLMTDYKFNFDQMYMLTIISDNDYLRIYINGELQTVAIVPFNPLVNPTPSLSKIKNQYDGRRDSMPLGPGFYKKDGTIYTPTSTQSGCGLFSSINGLIFGKSALAHGTRGTTGAKKRRRYLNNLDIGVINSYNIALSQSEISQLYNNFRYRYI